MLFVDDDPVALAALRSAIADRSTEWDTAFVGSGAEALSEIGAGEPYDAVVTDLAMPQMDGASLLAIVRDRFPRTMRIAASDLRDPSLQMRAIPVAHQVLTLPLEAPALAAAIERSADLAARLEAPGLRDLINGIDVLPSPPPSVAALNRALLSTETSVDGIAKIIESDAAMTAKLLQLVNSAFFGLRHRVTSAHHAVSVLGVPTVRNLLSAVEIVRAFTPASGELWRAVDGLHAHSLAVAEMARSFVTHRHHVHDAFAAGLMHDIGLLAAASVVPDRFLELRHIVVSTGLPVTEVEREILGAPHAQLGAYLLSLWGLPFGLVEAVARSHDAEMGTHAEPTPAHAVFVAEQVVNMLGASPGSWEGGHLPGHDYLAAVGLDAVVTGLIVK